MKLTPRREEIAAVAAVLDSDEYETVQEMARAAIKALAVELGKRDWYVMPWSLPGEGGGINYGPFATAAELRRFAGTLPSGGHRAVLVLGPDRPRGTDDAEVHAGTCRCGHGQHNHVVKNVRGGKTSAPGECGVYSARNQRCPCTIYEQEK